MCRHDHGHAFKVEPPEQLEDFLGRLGIEVSRRLICQ